MRKWKNSIQAHYAYLSDLFKAIAFLIQELDSPHELEYSEIIYLDKLLLGAKKLPKGVSSTPKIANVSAYRVFLRDFKHLADEKGISTFIQMQKKWAAADEETKKICQEKADEENELRRARLSEKRRKYRTSSNLDT